MHLLGLLDFTAFVTSAGYGAIFVLCVLQSCCVPTSSEITLGFAGVLAAQGKLSLPAVIAVGVAGEVVGAYIAWAVGRYAGRAVVDRFGRYILLSHRDLDRAEAWYERHERFGVFGSRLLPVIRNFVALPAGIAEVPLVRFGLLTAAGSLLWDGAWAGIGYGVGSHWHKIASGFSDIGYVLGALAVVVIALALYHRYRSYKAAATDYGTAEAHDPRGEDGADGGEPGAGTVRWISSSSGRQRPPGPVVGTPSGSEGAGAGGVISPTDGTGSTAGGMEGGEGTAHAAGATEPDPRGFEMAYRDPVVASASSLPPAVTRVGAESSSRLARTHGAAHRHRRAVAVGSRQSEPVGGQLPLVGRFFPAPLAAKVPEVIFLFWVIKVLSTAGGEATSDYLKTYGNVKGGGVEVGLFALALVLQFSTRRYRAFAYWFLAFAIAIFGTGVSDFLHLDVGIPYAGTTLLWAVVLAAIFVVWYRSEGTLSIHSITTQRREAFYWATVFATFALGTALGDFTATSLNLGYLASGILFGVLILLPAIAWWRFGLNSVAAFWMSYVVTRPLGASFADYISKPHAISGINFGDGPTALVFALAVFVLVAYLAVARPDIQHHGDDDARPAPPYGSGVLGRVAPEPDPE